MLSHMAVESLTYAEIGERLGVSVHAARALVKRLRLPRMLNNDRKVIAQIDFSEIKHRPQPIAVVTNGLASISDSVPEFVVTKEASLHMDDAPQNLGSVPVTKTMWQTDMIAIRLKFQLSWILRDPRAVAWVQGCTW
ncbi:MAG TPA: hypothetical protein VM822_24625 [Pseudolabrys sp.]|nr:hypothetical protein [Pseudolabrys sp.]